jgi:hypothetical protein
VIEFGKAKLPPAAIAGCEDAANLVRFHSRLRARILPELDHWVAARLQTSGGGEAKSK